MPSKKPAILKWGNLFFSYFELKLSFMIVYIVVSITLTKDKSICM